MAVGMRRPPEITEEEWEFRLSPEVYMHDGEVSAAQADRLFRDWVRRTVAARRSGGVPAKPSLAPLVELPPRRADPSVLRCEHGGYAVQALLGQGWSSGSATSIRPIRGAHREFNARRASARPSGRGWELVWDAPPPQRVRERADAMLNELVAKSRSR